MKFIDKIELKVNVKIKMEQILGSTLLKIILRSLGIKKKKKSFLEECSYFLNIK